MIAEVIVDIAHSETDRVFDYIAEDGEISSRVEVPFGRQTKEGFVIGLKETSGLPSGKLKKIIRCPDEFPVIGKECLELARFVKETYHVPFALALRQFIPAELRGGRVKEKIVRFATLSSEISPVAMVAELRKGSTAQANAIGYLTQEKKARLSELNGKFGNQAIKKLIERNFVIVTDERASRIPYRDLVPRSEEVDLTEEQEKAVATVENAEQRVALLFGVTGSGKTEVYLRLISAALERGKTAIMLVPEIALTPQMLRQLRARFGDSVSILHSGLSAGERFDEWYRLKTGEARIAIGARSAIFAPLSDLGIVIVDEEHDGSYSSETNPRYSTFEIAKFRAEYNGGKLILGSATPSVETYLQAKEGKFGLYELPDRINAPKRANLI